MTAYAIAQQNATLSKVTTTRAADGGRDDWDSAPAAPVEKWAGSAPAYFTVKRRRVVGDDVDIVTVPTLIVSSLLADDIGLRAGDTVTYTVNGAQRVGTVANMSSARLDGVPVEVQTARLELAS